MMHGFMNHGTTNSALPCRSMLIISLFFGNLILLFCVFIYSVTVILSLQYLGISDLDDAELGKLANYWQHVHCFDQEGQHAGLCERDLCIFWLSICPALLALFSHNSSQDPLCVA
jgi:hypothetical protein